MSLTFHYHGHSRLPLILTLRHTNLSKWTRCIGTKLRAAKPGPPRYLHVVQKDSFSYICSAQDINPICACIRPESDTKLLLMQNTETTRQAISVRWNMATRSQNIRTHSAILKIWYRITRRQRFSRLVPPASTQRTIFHVKWPTSFQIVIKFRFSRHIFTKVSDIKRHGNPSGERRAVTCRWKDRQTYVRHEGKWQFWRLYESA